MRKIIFSIFLISILLGSVACNGNLEDSLAENKISETQNEIHDGLAYFTFYLEESQTKSLVAVANTGVEKYQFKATPNFQAEKIVGKESTWKDLTVIAGKASVGPFSTGNWTFEIRGLNSNSAVIYEGSTTAKLKTGTNMTVKVALSKPISAGKGNLDLTIRIPSNAEPGFLVMNIKGKNGTTTINNSDWTSIVDKTYKKTIELDAGSYSINVQYFINNISVGGEVLSAEIIQSETTVINGKMEHGTFVDPISHGGIEIEIPKVLSGTLGNDVFLTLGQSTSFKFQSNGGLDPISYSWAVDGVETTCTDMNFTFDGDATGKYYITCTVTDGETFFTEDVYCTVSEGLISVTIDPNEGISNVKTTVELALGETYAPCFNSDVIPTREGYVFDGYILED